MKEVEAECHFCRTNREMLENPDKHFSSVKFKGRFWNIFYRINPQNKHDYVAVSVPLATNKEVRKTGNHATQRVQIRKVAWAHLFTTVEKFRIEIGACSIDIHIPDQFGNSQIPMNHFRAILDVQFPKQPRS